MKALTLIPKEVKKTYRIEKCKNVIFIHQPVCVNIEMDEEFEIFEHGLTVAIKNSKCIVNLWKEGRIQHITIY